MPDFTKVRWRLWNKEKIYTWPEDESASMVYVAKLQGKNISERYANGILIAYAPEMYKALKAIREELPAIANAHLDRLFDAVFNAGRLLSNIDVQARALEDNAETEDTEP